MIDVVNFEMVRRIDHFTVHRNIFFLFPNTIATAGIESVILLDGVPFVLIQPLEILRIDDDVFSLSKLYPAEGVAVACPAI